MFRRSILLVSLVGVAMMAFALACGGDDEEEPVAAAPPTSTPKAEPVAVPTPAVPTAAPPTAMPVAMLEPGSSYSDIIAGPEIGNIDSDIFNKNRFGGVLKWVPQGTVPNLDGMISGSAIGRGVSWHFWESLAQWDAAGALQPDLADSWTVAEDSSGAHYTFKLRDGRSWHEGGKPLPEDIEASLIQRFLSRDVAFAPTIKDLLQSFETVDEDTFIVHLSEPTGLLLMAFGYVGGTQPQIMPKATVDKYPDVVAEEFNASGPYMFNNWDPGNEVVLDRYDAYVPRTEEPSYRAGAKMGYFARMIAVEIPDQETRVAAVLTGEVDALDVISGDFYEAALENDDKVSVHIGVPGAQPDIGFNLGDPLLGFTERGRLMREAIRAAINAEEVMKGYGTRSLWTLCPALQHCGVAWEEPSTNTELYNENNPAKAKQLMEQAGYNGEEIIILDAADFPTLHVQAPVLVEQLKAVGINAKVTTTDWAGQLQIANSGKDWHIFTNWNSSNLYHPLVATHYRTYTGDIADAVGTYGYPVGIGYENGDRMEQLRKDFANAKTREEEIAITKQMADIAWSDPRRVVFGQFFQLRVQDKRLRDVDVRGHPVGSPLYLNQWWGDAGKRAEDPR
jgi:peptide/nickel transport system substrate-binding protein